MVRNLRSQITARRQYRCHPFHLQITSTPPPLTEVFTLFKGPLVNASTVEAKLCEEHDAWRIPTAEEWAPLASPQRARVLAIATEVLRGGRCPYLREANHLARRPVSNQAAPGR
ncbi:hypothetical protein [Streptomyces abikoensis]|uniref:hypothetical protein n=1 Tax=Streptomyces abikoensis TaxID=97398 RepID=UPI0036C60A12